MRIPIKRYSPHNVPILKLIDYSVPARKFGQRGTIIEKRALLCILVESKGHTLYILGEIMVMLFYFLASNSISMQIKLYTEVLR